jgi:hypothetical protein
VGVAVSRSPASAGLTSARPRISASTFPCVERWTRRAAFDGWPSPNRTLPTSGRLMSSREHRPTGSSRLPASLARPGPPPRTPVKAYARAARGAFRHRRAPRSPSCPGARGRNPAPPWIVWRKDSAHPFTVCSPPRVRVSGTAVGIRLDPRVLSAGPRCVRPDFCFPLPSIEHPRLVCSRRLRTGDPDLSHGQSRFGGATCVPGGRLGPVVRLSSEPLMLLAAGVAARLGRCRPAACESGQTDARPEAPFIRRDPLLADLRQRLERHVLRPASTHDTVSPALLRSPLSGRSAGTS